MSARNRSELRAMCGDLTQEIICLDGKQVFHRWLEIPIEKAQRILPPPVKRGLRRDRTPLGQYLRCWNASCDVQRFKL